MKNPQSCSCWGDPLVDAIKTWVSANSAGAYVIAKIRHKDIFTHIDRPLRQYFYFVGHRLACGHWDIDGEHFKTLAEATTWES